MRIVHFVSDEKFIDAAITLADAVGKPCEFVALEPTTPLAQWVQVRQRDRIREVLDGTPEMSELLARRETLFVLHSGAKKTMRFCRHLKARRARGNAILWLPWGHDYAELIDHHTYGAKTARLLEATPLRRRGPFSRFSQWIKTRGFLRTVDFYPRLLETERAPFRRLLRRDALEAEGDWSYYLDPPTLPTPAPFTSFDATRPPRIMLNHSAAWENNHADGLCAIAPFLLPGQRITVPISYNWAADVLRKVLPTLPGGDRVDFLDKWLSLEAWWKEIAACDIFVQSARRQIANGATTAALAFGKKVFLSEHNPFLAHYRAMGVRIFSLERDLGPNAFSTPLTQEEATNNIRLIAEKQAIPRSTRIEEAKRFFDFIEAHMPIARQ